ncbi:MAG: cbb3-type cytochrome oxidase assembly protein CcoS [Bacteroidetes bacterium]|nr:cbb3-type cytochrome oxidase assembly protein CcoS [Bacteroidota bacterium]
MSVLFVLISACLLMALLFLLAFVWSVKEGQYDDDYTPAMRILFDDTTRSDSSNKTNPEQ